MQNSSLLKFILQQLKPSLESYNSVAELIVKTEMSDKFKNMDRYNKDNGFYKLMYDLSLLVPNKEE